MKICQVCGIIVKEGDFTTSYYKYEGKLVLEKREIRKRKSYIEYLKKKTDSSLYRRIDTDRGRDFNTRY